MPEWIIEVCRTCERVARYPFCEHRPEGYQEQEGPGLVCSGEGDRFDAEGAARGSPLRARKETTMSEVGSRTDPLWVDVTEGIRVIMSAGHAKGYQEWLRERGLHLYRIPDRANEDDPFYAVGVRDETRGGRP